MIEIEINEQSSKEGTFVIEKYGTNDWNADN